MKCPSGALALLLFFLSPLLAYADSYQGNSQKLEKRYPLQYKSWLHSLDSSEEPDPETPANPAQMIIYGSYYNYRDLVAGKRSHANGMLEVYTSIGGDTGYLQRCLPCHSSDAPGLYKKWGEDVFYQGKDFDPLASGVNPVGCANCHNTETMKLRVANPYALRAIKKSGKDPDRLSRHELKSYICAQCHFEYDKVSKNGVTTIEMNWELYGNLDKLAAFYDEEAAVSYTHPLSQAPLVKPMNNEAGLAMSGSHFKHGVACADCHFPKISERGKAYTSHDNVRGSRDIAAACRHCHTDVGQEQLEKDVRDRMAQYGGENIRQLEKSLAETHLLIRQALDAGATAGQLAAVYKDLRAAQWRWDYLLWQKGGAFHAPFETQKMLADALVRTNSAKTAVFLLLSGLGVKDVRIPDFSSVEEAARILGLAYPRESSGESYDYLKEPLERAVEKGSLDENIYGHTMQKLFVPKEK